MKTPRESGCRQQDIYSHRERATLLAIIQPLQAATQHALRRRIRWSCVLSLVLIALGFSQSGCIHPTVGASVITYGNRSVAQKPELWGGYKPDEVYALLSDVFLMPHNGLPSGLAMVLSGETSKALANTGTYQTGPPSVRAYLADPAKWPNVVGVVVAGTRLKIVDIRKAGDFLRGQSLHIRAQILDGPFAERIADLCDLSKSAGTYEKTQLVAPDRRLLELRTDSRSVS